MSGFILPRLRLSLLALVASQGGAVHALGLNAAAGSVLLGQPVRVSIPVEVGDGRVPNISCFRLQQPSSPSDHDYVLTDASLQLDISANKPRLMVTSRRNWHHPVVEFRVVASCGGVEVMRDYTLLADLPLEPVRQRAAATRTEAIPAPPPLSGVSSTPRPLPPQGEMSTLVLSQDSTLNAIVMQRYPDNRELRDAYRMRMIEANLNLFAGRSSVGGMLLPAGTTLNLPPGSSAEPQRAPVPVPGAVAVGPKSGVAAEEGDTLRLNAATNLNALARERYPDDRALRDDYRRQMAAANAGLFAGQVQVGSVHLPAGTVLRLPSQLPAPQRGTTTSSTAPGVALPVAARPAAKMAPSASAKLPGKEDRLVIGSSSTAGSNKSALSPELIATIERLERMSEDQGRTQVKISDNLDALETAVATLAKSLIQMEDRMHRLDIERAQAEEARLKALAQLAEERDKFGLVEILILIVAAGGVVAALIFYYERLRSRQARPMADMPAVAPTAVPVDAVAPEPRVAAARHPAATQPARVRPPERSPQPAGTPATPRPGVRAGHVSAAPLAAAAAAAPVAAVATVAGPASADVTPLMFDASVETGGNVDFPPLKLPAAGAAAPRVSDDVASEADSVAEIEFSLDDQVELTRPAGAHSAAPGLAESASPAHEEIEVDFDPFTPVKGQQPVQDGNVDMTIDIALGSQYEDGLVELPDLQGTKPADGETKVVADAALELAEVMASMGFSHGAAEVLVENIRDNPADAGKLWLKFLDLYHENDLREEMSDSLQELKSNFNVNVTELRPGAGKADASLMDYRHIVQALVQHWKTGDCDAYLLLLLADTRGGTRDGFPRAVVEEILLLRGILQTRKEMFD